MLSPEIELLVAKFVGIVAIVIVVGLIIGLLTIIKLIS